ncbi:MAG: penicillin-binding transpeptidase domain-containing protein [Bryobacteraceae bacterium]
MKKRVHRPAARKTSRRPAIRKAKYTRPRKVYSPWTEPTYADSTLGDNVDGEVLEVRRAAVEALGQYNGSVVVVDPNTGRILTMVNQKLALGSGFQPCSTIKVPVALAALAEGLIAKDKIMPAAGARMNLTTALAKSNNSYFANLGIKLGYDRVSFYARMFGLGEKAGLNIPGESPGYFPKAPPKNGGMGMLTSFGEEISLTPLQLAAMMSAVANDGTLYYLQYPRSEAEAENLVPRIKRRLDMEQWIPEVKPGLAGTVQFGTARRAFEPDDPVLGKTGTCTEARTHLGWFGSFNDIGPNKLVVVVLLTGGRPSVGSTAAGVASDVYSRLSETNYFTRSRPITPVALISIGQ